MKKVVIFFGFFLIFYSCSVKKSPVFLKVDDFKIINIASDTIRLGANAYFNNPNDVSGNIYTNNLKVFINEADVAQVSSDVYKVPARKDFAIPLKIAIPSKRFFENTKNGILGGLFNTLMNKPVKVQLKGKLDYVVLGFKKEFIIDKTEEIIIKL
ncbi:MAG: hypothetical protein GW772_05330 [Flavobacteriia bacterium]|nr:hypothetical protein [Flavobacteriia bacterium]OIP47294.1 MAG: hypothetical protein AUK46_05535 [Flavobacteriaceae bacterium CG2_30_31_66]PIV96124.1 MAG: hypothetical protein COW43_09650 [Flavobacteriaceae bacterium CG17_big_fil_post_rev_8_21_14_2_50_31_13]PIX13050.1 MAG: hypothetical protein COZ74_08325 [Flavobacteriaceae bacterium CG_4_8_14_3_um_filter_31_8]PIY14341.1 MAG: hypothetical protein COZ16_09380 [Flavobacteriaceae bacterium CG_4_10_14_3_um_filter_31_253]PIZ10428.1 MAG: hypotheti